MKVAHILSHCRATAITSRESRARGEHERGSMPTPLTSNALHSYWLCAHADRAVSHLLVAYRHTRTLRHGRHSKTYTTEPKLNQRVFLEERALAHRRPILEKKTLAALSHINMYPQALIFSQKQALQQPVEQSKSDGEG